MPLDLVLLFGSVRTHRRGDAVVRYVDKRLRGRGHRATLLDARALNLPMLDRMYKEFPAGEAPEGLQRMAEVLEPADAFVVICGEYNHAPPAGLKNMLDHFLQEWFWRPSAIVSYSAGAFGGVRAAVQLRAILCELGMPSIPSIFPVPRVAAAFDAEEEPTDGAMDRRFDKFASELEWYAEALRSRRQGGVPY
ncbi:MAG TPA: NAD(P)H-dependent oxidoreductase [Candidatus Polarisedimenticolaceae bacterium]|nr:NAD(P)H-dependent oxidoreductase [Candidatus Polarisedimenticolaceae bacterium]